MSTTASNHYVFSFGTLLDPAVQKHLFGRELPLLEDRLTGYRFTEVLIDDPAVIAASGLPVHRGVARAEGASVPGAVIALSDEELASADRYEVDAYIRRRVRTQEHGEVWAYVAANPFDAAERVGIIGDSIAYGRSDVAHGWAQLVATAHVSGDEARRRFFNLAIPGATAQELTRFAAAETGARRCDTVVIACGINDLLTGAGHVKSTIAAVASIAEDVEAYGARAVVVGPVWVDGPRAATAFGARIDDAVVRAYDEGLVAWGSDTHRDVVSVYRVLEGRKDLFTDGVHPTRDGHALLAEAILGR